MWFQGMLWKLPLPVSDGLQYWTEQESTSAAFEFHRTFLKEVVLPHMSLFGPIVFVAELVFAGSMMLGLAVRFVGILAIAYTLQLLWSRPPDVVSALMPDCGAMSPPFATERALWAGSSTWRASHHFL